MTSNADPFEGRPVLALAVKHGISAVLAAVLLYVMLIEQRQQLRAIEARSAETLTIINAMVGRCLDATKPIIR